MTNDPATKQPRRRVSSARLAFAFWLPVALYVTLIFMVSSEQYLKPPLHFPNSDKVMHVMEYGVLGLLLSRALRASAPGARGTTLAAIAIVIGITVGANDEWYQSFVPGRQSSVFDLMADTAGVVLAQLVPRGILPE